MKWKVKASICSALILFAVLSVTAVAGQLDRIMPGEAQMASLLDGDDEIHYVLREQDGFVAIFQEGFGDEPAVVTDIEAKTLRQVDRELLRLGIPVKNREELMMLLEDLGS